MSLYSTFIIRSISTLSQRVALLTERPRMVRIYTSLTSSDLLSPLLLKKRGEREEVFTRSTPWTKERLGSSSHPVSRFVSSRPVSSRRFASRRVASRCLAFTSSSKTVVEQRVSSSTNSRSLATTGTTRPAVNAVVFPIQYI